MSTSNIQKVSVLGKESIYIGPNLFDFIPQDLKSSLPKVAKFVCVTDSNIAQLWLNSLQSSFSTVLGVRLEAFVIPPGEPAKIRSTKDAIEDWMLSLKCGRDTCVIALGGGVVGDLVGFVASTFMRGVPVVQIPTSLLAMVDSSIGGKTGLDTLSGKNLIGSFHQPHRIYLDMSLLSSLPSRHLSNGMAEVIKTAAFWSLEFFDWLEANVDLVLAKDPKAIQFLVLECVKVKAQVVTEDEKELTGLRSLLNFGHTIGHAIEALCQPEMLHGEAVSLGMIKEAEVSRSLGLLSQANVARLVDCLDAYGLPTKYPSLRFSVQQMMDKMSVDKKNEQGVKTIVLLKSIGSHITLKGDGNKPIGASKVSDKVIRRVLSNHVAVVSNVSNNNNNNNNNNSNNASSKHSVFVPGSKSISNRVLLMAGLGKGTCKISGLLHSDDTRVMLKALKDLGIPHISHENDGNIVSITGSEGKLLIPKKEVYLGNAGTAARFLTTTATLVKGGNESPNSDNNNNNSDNNNNNNNNKSIILTGNKRMKERPNGPLIDALTANGAKIRCLEKSGCLPIDVTCENGLKGGDIQLAANISSQYVSSILISAPYAETPVELCLVGGQVVSEPYIDMTLALMRDFGLKVSKRLVKASANPAIEEPVYSIPKFVYENPKEYMVEGDASSATYPLAIAAITGKTVTVENVGSQSLQGDAQFCKLLLAMGCSVVQTPTSTTVTGPSSSSSSSRLKALGKIDMGEMTDAFMTLAVLCAVAEGTTQIVNIANQRVKECNRILAMVEELQKMGVTCRELEDGIEIEGSHPSQLKGAAITCHDDHRIAMSFAVLGCVVPNVVITERACVEKTYPEFWDDISLKLGVQVEAVAESSDSSESNESSESNSNSNETNTISNTTPSLIFIGMRGAGKSTLGAAVAAETGREFIDLDEYIEKRHLHGEKIIKFVESNGWSKFREIEFLALSEILSFPSFSTTAITTSSAASSPSYVLSCGGGVVETPAARSLLAQYPFTIQLSRSIDDIVEYLESDSSRPKFSEHPRDVFKRRLSFYRACSKYEFVIRKNDVDWQNITSDLVRLVRFIANSNQERQTFNSVGVLSSHNIASSSGWLFPVETLKTPTCFLSLTFPSLEPEFLGSNFTSLLSKISTTSLTQDNNNNNNNSNSSSSSNNLILEEVLSSSDSGDTSVVGPKLLSRICESGVHAIELRVDLLTCHTDLEAVANEVAILKRLAPPNIPIIFTVRSKKQGGNFTGTEQEMFALLKLGVRLGCEYIDMESDWSEASRESLLKLCETTNSRVIGSYHVPVGWGQEHNNNKNNDNTTLLSSSTPVGLNGKKPVSEVEWNALRGKFDDCSHGGRVQVIKVIARASTIEDCFSLSNLSKTLSYKKHQTTKESETIPILTLCMGEAGSLSRALNMVMTPVTHSLLPAKAAPGQLSVPQIHQLRHLSGLLPSQQFILLGSPIRLSMSPTFHNTAFQIVGLPHHYSLCETTDVETAVKTLKGELPPPQQLDSFSGVPVKGASVTIPLKETIIPFMQSLTPAAKLIGAVNTVTVVSSPPSSQGGLLLHGDNTDWLGMARCIAQKTNWSINDDFLSGSTSISGSGSGSGSSSGSSSTASYVKSNRRGLIIGGGGTARAAVYALLSVGVSNIVILNRTVEKAQLIANAFTSFGNIYATSELTPEFLTAHNFNANTNPSSSYGYFDVIIGTLPASVNFVLPEFVLEFGQNSGKGTNNSQTVLLDAAYIPFTTALISQVNKYNYSVIHGIDMLIEQAVAQFEIWAGIPCPYQTVRHVVMSKYLDMIKTL